MTHMQDCTDAFAVPGSDSLIDVVHPETGLSWCFGHTLEEIQAREPGAERMSVAAWCAAKAERQHAPITWAPCTKERYWEMLEVVPPAVQHGGGFLVGEPTDHDASNGQPRFAAYRERDHGHYQAYSHASRPLTRAEFAAETNGRGA